MKIRTSISLTQTDRRRPNGPLSIPQKRKRRSRAWAANAILGAIALSCTAAYQPVVAAPVQIEQQQQIVDTNMWLRTINDPPAAWRNIVERRDDVLRHRFVRFQQPANIPSPRSRFIVQPFADTRLTMRMRRANPVGKDSYSWFGVPEGDSFGWGGIVVRANGRISLSINTKGKRFEAINVGNNVYAFLELTPRKPSKCHFHSHSHDHSHDHNHNHDHPHGNNHNDAKEC